jgi:hypothetical protein
MRKLEDHWLREAIRENYSSGEGMSQVISLTPCHKEALVASTSTH